MQTILQKEMDRHAIAQQILLVHLNKLSFTSDTFGAFLNTIHEMVVVINDDIKWVRFLTQNVVHNEVF